jgi:hypothetical protein
VADNEAHIYEHDDPLPDDDGVLLPQESLPDVPLGAVVTFLHTPTGAKRSGVVVAFDEHSGERWLAIKYR